MQFSKYSDAKRTRLVNHQGKIVDFIESSASDEALLFSVYDPTTDTPPSDPAPITYPSEIRTAGMSLITVPDDAVPNDLTAAGSWEVLSDNSYIYLFRALPVGSTHQLCANRYILVPVPGESEDDPVTYGLVQKTEARYQQTMLRETPGSATDKPDFRDLDGKFFHEPVILFPGINPRDGRFCISLLPTNQPPTLRWMIFTDTLRKGAGPGGEDIPGVAYHSLPRDAFGWIDYGVGEDKSAVSQGHFSLIDRKSRAAIAMSGQPSCRMFRRQERTPGDATDAMTGPRVALAATFDVPDANGGAAKNRLVAIDFALAANGTPIISDNAKGEIVVGAVQRALTALALDGERDSVTIPATLPVTPEHLTFEVWLRNEGRSGSICTRVVEPGSTEPGFSMWFDADKGTVEARFRLLDAKARAKTKAKTGKAAVAPPTLAIAAPAPSCRQWHHIAAVCSFTDRTTKETTFELKLFLDGSCVAKKTETIETTVRLDIHANGETWLGRDPADIVPDLAGTMDEVRIWKAQRKAKQIDELMYRELSDSEVAAETDLIGYWKFDDAYSDAPWIAKDSKADNDGKVSGAAWTTDSAPISPPDGPAVPPSLDGLSSDMGILDFVEDPVIRDPLLEDGADGLLHLYFATGVIGSDDLALKVLHYDTTVSRARYALPWKADGGSTEGSLVLAARDAGPALNRARKDAPVVSAKKTPKAGGALLDVTFAARKAVGGSETYTAVPTEPKSFSKVINGQASADPLDPKVRTGEVPYYDYSGSRPTVDLPTKSGAPLRLVTARNALFPSALPIAEANVTSTASTLTLEVDLVPIECTVKDKGNANKTVTVKRAVRPKLTFAKVPKNSARLFAVLDGVAPGGFSIENATVAAISAGKSPVYVVYDPARPVTVRVTPTSATHADVTVTVTVSGTKKSAKWEDAPREPAEFIAAMNLQGIGAVPSDQIAVAADFVMVGANNTGPVDGASNVLKSPDRLASFINAIGTGVSGPVTSNGKVPLAPVEGKTVEGMDVATASGSVLFAATPFAPPEDGRAAHLIAADGVLEGAGNFGGWIPTPPTTSGDFSQSAAESTWTSLQSQAVDLSGDFTFEAWVRPQDLAEPQRLITASTPSGSDFTVGLHEEPTYSVYSGASQRGTALSPVVSPNLTFTMWWLGDPVATDGVNAASLSFHSILGIEWFVLGRIQSPGGDIWEGLFGSMLPTPHRVPMFIPGQAPVAPHVWYFLCLEMDFDASKASLYWRKIGAPAFEAGTFNVATPFTAKQMMSLSYGRPIQIIGSTDGATQRVAEMAVWDRKLTAADRERLFRGPPIRNAAGLQYSWNVPDTFGGTTGLTIQNRALFGPDLPLDFDAGTSRGEGPKPTRKLYAGAGPRFVEASVPLVLNDWAHVAVACSDNNALAFDGTQVAVAKESTVLSFGEQMSIDARLQFNGLPANETESMILSKSDNADTDTSYQLSCDAAGVVTLTVALDDQSTYSHTAPDVVLPKGRPAYLAVSAKIVEVEPDTFEFKYEAKDGAGKATSENRFTTQLVIRMYLRTDDAFVQTAPRTIVLYTGGSSKSYEVRRSQAPVTIGARSAEPSPLDPKAPRAFFAGVMGGVRLWSFDISTHFVALSESEDVPEELADGLEANWRMDEGRGRLVKDVVAGHDAELPTSYMWTKARLTSDFRLYVGDQLVASDLVPQSTVAEGYGDPKQLTVGAVKSSSAVKEQFSGQMDDIRLWSVARSAAEIADNLYTELSGGEADLAAYWPVDIGSGTLIKDATGRGNSLALTDPTKQDSFWWIPMQNGTRLDESPIGNEAPQIANALHGPKSRWQVTTARSATSTVEYGALYTDSQGVQQGVQYRGYSYIAADPTDPAKSVRRFIPSFKVGEADLTYIGQAQSDPTILGYIEGAPPVPQENLTRPYYDRPSSYQTYNGVSAIKITETDETSYTYTAGKDTGFNLNSEFSIGLSYATATKLVMAPIGLGINISGPSFQGKAGLTASFSYSTGFLESSERMVGTSRGRVTEVSTGGNWEPMPPANSGLERHYIPDNLGAALVKSGTANVYALRLKTTGALSGILMSPDPSIARDFNIVLFPINPNYTKQGTLDGMQGFETDPNYPEANLQRGSYFKPREAADLEQQILLYEASLAGDYAAFKAGELGRDPIGDPAALLDDEISAPVDYAARQSRRNLVNTFVWTADGGLFTESMQALSKRVETQGGTYSFEGLGGLAGDFEADLGPLPIGLFFDGKLLLGGHVEATVEKSNEESLDFALDVTNETEDFLARWLPSMSEPEDDGQSEPGKVTAFRFKSFYLAPAAESFDTFFSTVVDPNWLATSDENAAFALRQARTSRNHVWRVLHRVTYVERVPPVFNQTPQETAEKPARTLVDLTQNGLLMRFVEDRLAGKTGTLPERISSALAEVLAPNGPVADRVAWWDKLLAEAATDVTGPSAAAVRQVGAASRSYALAYFE